MRIRTKICEIFIEMSKKLNNKFNDKNTICEICGKALDEIMEIINLYETQTNPVDIMRKLENGAK